MAQIKAYCRQLRELILTNLPAEAAGELLRGVCTPDDMHPTQDEVELFMDALDAHDCERFSNDSLPKIARICQVYRVISKITPPTVEDRQRLLKKLCARYEVGSDEFHYLCETLKTSE